MAKQKKKKRTYTKRKIDESMDFGYEFKKTERERQKRDAESFAIPANNDGAITINNNGFYGLLGVSSNNDVAPTVQSEIDLITRYRELLQVAEVDDAVDQIVSEAIIQENNKKTVTIDLTKCDKLTDEIKRKVEKEFDNIQTMLNWNNNAYEIFKRWYTDGRLYYHVIIKEDSDANKSADGILEIRYVDPRQIKKVREVKSEVKSGVEITTVIDEYFVFNKYGITNTNTNAAQSATGIKITEDSIVYIHSGILDKSSTMILSHLQKAIKPTNQLKMLEDSLIIYRLVRAPQRRIFNIDVGNLPTTKANQYVQEVIAKYRNNITYDIANGEISGGPRVLSMLEDYWIPKREGASGTTIDTAPGGENLGVIDDILYFAKKLYKALGIPASRLGSDGSGLNNSRATEVTRDELQFSRFIDRLRRRFAILFDELLKKQLITKRILDEDVWEQISEQIFYNFCTNNHFAELMLSQSLKDRLETLEKIDPYVNKYFSQEWVREKVLYQSIDEQKMIDEQIKKSTIKSNLEEPNLDAEPTGEHGAPEASPFPAQKIDEPKTPEYLAVKETDNKKPALNGVIVNDKTRKFV